MPRQLNHPDPARLILSRYDQPRLLERSAAFRIQSELAVISLLTQSQFQ